VLEDLLDSARLAPSANNLQRFHIVVVTDDRMKAELVDACGGQDFGSVGWAGAKAGPETAVALLKRSSQV